MRTPRRFAREYNSIFHQLWVDANGFGGKARTCFVLCANLPFGPTSGYLDPHGFRICAGRMWPTQTTELAEKSLVQVTAALEQSELSKLESLGDIPAMLEQLRPLSNRSWHTEYSHMFSQWQSGDKAVLEIVAKNRKSLGL